MKRRYLQMLIVFYFWVYRALHLADLVTELNGEN